MSFANDLETVVTKTSTAVENENVQRENVSVNSSISADSTNKVTLNIGSEKFDQLMARLSSTHAQLDHYSQQRTHQISLETQKIIEKILEETKEKQRFLLLEAQRKCEEFQEEYQRNLQDKINLLNQDKAQQLLLLEKSLNDEQESILQRAKQQIDLIQKQANQRKIEILKQAEQTTNQFIENITEQVVHLAQQDSTQRLATSTTTCITTQAIAQANLQQQQTDAQLSTNSYD